MSGDVWTRALLALVAALLVIGLAQGCSGTTCQASGLGSQTCHYNLG